MPPSERPEPHAATRFHAGPFELLPQGMVLSGHELVLADLHLGYEAAQGPHVALPPRQTIEILERLNGVLDAHDVRRVVVAGDLKHAFHRNAPAERRDVATFVAAVQKRAPLLVVRGNHDNFLGSLLPDDVPLVGQHSLETSARVVHGHQDAPPHAWTVQGHVHPILRVRDEVGAVVEAPCFLVADGAEGVVVLPAQNPWTGGGNILHPDTLGERFSPVAARAWLQLRPVVWSGQEWLEFPPLARWP